MAAVLRVRDNDGNIVEIPAIKGDKGDKGDKPVVGTDYFTPSDKAEMVQMVLDALPNGDEVSY